MCKLVLCWLLLTLIYCLSWIMIEFGIFMFRRLLSCWNTFCYSEIFLFLPCVSPNVWYFFSFFFFFSCSIVYWTSVPFKISTQSRNISLIALLAKLSYNQFCLEHRWKNLDSNSVNWLLFQFVYILIFPYLSLFNKWGVYNCSYSYVRES